jgi:hypothetical protein
LRGQFSPNARLGRKLWPFPFAVDTARRRRSGEGLRRCSNFGLLALDNQSDVRIEHVGWGTWTALLRFGLHLCQPLL